MDNQNTKLFVYENVYEHVVCEMAAILSRRRWAKIKPNYNKTQLNVGIVKHAWWRHQMETFSALLAICAGNSPVPGEFPAQKPVTQSFDVLFDPGLNKQLSKQLWGWWFETLSCSLCRHCNGKEILIYSSQRWAVRADKSEFHRSDLVENPGSLHPSKIIPRNSVMGYSSNLYNFHRGPGNRRYD